MQLDRTESNGITVLSVTSAVKGRGASLEGLRDNLVAKADLTRPTVLDLGRLDFLSSVNLGVLVMASRAFHDRGGCLILASIGPRLAEIFHLVNLHTILILRSSVAEALTDIAQSANDWSELLKKNPTLEQFRESWKQNELAGQAGNSESILAAEARENYGVRDFKRLRGTAEDLTPPPEVLANQESLSEWTEALLLMARTQEIARRNGILFDVAMSYAEFLAALSRKLQQ